MYVNDILKTVQQLNMLLAVTGLGQIFASDGI